jgi:hypothetical protein
VVLVAEEDELLELARLAMQPVETPDHHAVARPELYVGQESLVLGTEASWG